MAVRRSTENLSGILNSMVLCTICNDTSGDTSVIETTCKHKFHRMCLSSWLDSNETCPNCRQPCAQALVRNAASDRRSGVQGNQGLPPPPNTGAVPKPRINTRSQARGNSNSQAFRSNPRRDSVSAKPPDASDSNAMTEERIQRLISQSLDSYRDSMAAMISEQITAAVRNLNLAPPRQESHDEPQLEWENDIAPSFPRLSSVSNMRMRDDANSISRLTVALETELGVEDDDVDLLEVSNLGIPRSVWMRVLGIPVLEFTDEYLTPNFLTDSYVDECVQGFEAIGFPQCLGAIDGCHIEIDPPAAEAVDHHNYKGWSSVVLFAMVDYRFQYVDIGAPGRCNDFYIFQSSSLSKMLNSCPLLESKSRKICGVDVPVLLIGDSAFRFSRNLMKKSCGECGWSREGKIQARWNGAAQPPKEKRAIDEAWKAALGEHDKEQPHQSNTSTDYSRPAEEIRSAIADYLCII
ncbi:hypothetical protein ACLKA6_000624 [Drosophila palustris]